MRYIVFLCSISLVLLPVFAEALAKPIHKEWTPEQSMRVNNITGINISPDNEKVIYNVISNKFNAAMWASRSNIYQYNLNTHRRVMVTNDKYGNHDPRWSKNNKFVAYLSARRGVSNVWVKKTSREVAEQITHSKTSITNYKWSPDSKSIVYVNSIGKKANKVIAPVVVSRPKYCTNMWLIKVKQHSLPRNITGYSDKNLCANITSINWSPDGKSIVFTRTGSNLHDVWNHGDLYIYNIISGKTRLVHKNKPTLFELLHLTHSDHIVYHQPLFSHNGKYIAFISWSSLYITTPDGKYLQRIPVAKDIIPANIVGWSKDDKKIIITQRSNTYVELVAVSVATGYGEVLNKKNKLIRDVRLSPDGAMISFSMQDSRHPVEGYLSNVNGFSPRQITYINKSIDKHRWPKTKVIHWRSTDGLSIEGLLTMPKNYNPQHKYPLLVEIHGGPGDSFQQRFVARPSVFPIATFSSLGYLYLRPNIRGSSAYGNNFEALNHKDWGGKDYQDVISGVDFLIKKGMVNTKKIGILGWSYGGYMAAWAISQSSIFSAASIGGGIVNLISYAGTNDLPSFVSDALGGNFWDNNLQIYLKRSPIFYVQHIKTPTLLEYGENDIRVPSSQGRELYRALKIMKVPVRFLIFPNTAHSIRIPQLLLDSANENVVWFNKYLKHNS